MNKNLSPTRRLTTLGVLLAVTILLSVTPLGFISFGVVSATTTHIPTILAGIILGPFAGFIMGVAMGITSLLNALLRPTGVLDPLFINPLISILPRMLIGVVAYYAYALVVNLISKHTLKQTLGLIFGGILGSMTNTILVLGMLYVVYLKRLIELFGANNSQEIRVMLIGVITSNALVEAGVAGLLVTMIGLAYYQVYKNEINASKAKKS